MRIGLRDDCGPYEVDPGSTAFSVPISLDGDRPGGACGCGCAEETVPESPPVDTGLPTLTVRERVIAYYDSDGVPNYEWQDLFSAVALMFEERDENNDATGQTRVIADATIGWPTDVRAAKEKDVAIDSRGRRWAILSAQPGPGRLVLKLEWLDQNE